MNRRLLRKHEAARMVGGVTALERSVRAGEIVPVLTGSGRTKENRYVYSELVAWQEDHRRIVVAGSRSTKAEFDARFETFREEFLQNARQNC